MRSAFLSSICNTRTHTCTHTCTHCASVGGEKRAQRIQHPPDLPTGETTTTTSWCRRLLPLSSPDKFTVESHCIRMCVLQDSCDSDRRVSLCSAVIVFKRQRSLIKATFLYLTIGMSIRAQKVYFNFGN